MPLTLSSTTIGYLMSFTPTLSIWIFLVSGRFWMSFIGICRGEMLSFFTLLLFIIRGTGILRLPDSDLAYLYRIMDQPLRNVRAAFHMRPHNPLDCELMQKMSLSSIHTWQSPLFFPGTVPILRP